MKILKTSILPLVGMLSLTMLGTNAAAGYYANAPAVQEYTQSNNNVNNWGTIGSVTGTTAFGLRFTGTNGGVTNANFVTNYGTIISGIGYGNSYGSYTGNAGIFFNAVNGQSNLNMVINKGNIIGISHGAGLDQQGAGIIFDASYGGDAYRNLVINRGLIQVSGSGSGIGVGFFADNYTTSANNNAVINFATIDVSSSVNVSAPGAGVTGIQFSGVGYGDASGNTVINKGTIKVSSPQNSAVGIEFDGYDHGVSNDNTVINHGSITAVGDYAYGIHFDGSVNGSVSHNTITNYGSIVASSAGHAIGVGFDGSNSGAANNNTVTNYGSIVVSGPQAVGVYVNGSGGSASNNVITNWGTISVAPGGAVIQIVNGTNNTINLRGHSSVNGMIAATGTNNVLNIAFSGVNHDAAKKLRAELGTALNGQPSSGTFTLRGVTYTYDPLIVQLNVTSYAQQGKTPNQKAIGANLDSFSVNPTGRMLDLLNALDWSGNVPRGLEALSPQRYQIYGDIALANADATTQEIDARLNNVRLGSEGLDSSRLGVSSSNIQSKLGMGDNKQMVALATMKKDGKGVDLKETAPEAKRWGAFISGNLILADLDASNKWQQDSKFNTQGLLGGVDMKITDALTAGLLLGYSHTHAELDSHDSAADVDTYSTGAYAGYHEGNYYGNGLFTYSRNNYESSRDIALTGISHNADATTSGAQYVLNIDGGYDHHVSDAVVVGPFAGLEYVNLGVNSFTESGAGAANLNINNQGMESLRSRLGVRLEFRKELCPCWSAASEVRVAWQREFLNNDRAIVAQFAGSGLSSFAVRANVPDRNAALLGLGLNATYRETWTAFADYDVQVGQANYFEQIIKAGLKWSF